MKAFYESPEGEVFRESQVAIGAEAKLKQRYPPEAREKMRVAKLGKPHARARTAEWNEKIAAAQKGVSRMHQWSPERRAAHAAKLASPETRAKMSASAKARRRGEPPDG